MRRVAFPLLILVVVILVEAGCKSREKAKPVANFRASSEVVLPSGDVLYDIPKGWLEEKPSGEMRKAQYKWPGTGKATDAEMAVFFFPGTGGSVEANVDRWFGQFLQPDGSSTKAKAEIKQIDVNGLAVTIVHVAGTYMKPKSPMMMGGPFDELKDYALLAAIVETANGPWFFKTTGPEKTIARWRSSFDTFTQSLRMAGESR